MELEPNTSHLGGHLEQEQAQSLDFQSCLQEIQFENQELKRALEAEQEERENERREREMKDERIRIHLEECHRCFDHNLELLEEERNNNEVLKEELLKERAEKEELVKQKQGKQMEEQEAAVCEQQVSQKEERERAIAEAREAFEDEKVELRYQLQSFVPDVFF
ncbi:hypothetical protein WMY93_032004 [Mugilogobius chulae]|uniref:Uncharacterized protein n=1 Tax=Mugilogobius chulae TaxID=88201 RepID=A0AAW0MEW0_9GOBI